MTKKTERHIKDRSEVITAAAYVLIDSVRDMEQSEGSRSAYGELELDVGLAKGGMETWVIRIERTASSH